MKLKDLTHIVNIPVEYQGIEFTGLTNNSREVNPGDLFIAIPGFKTDGFLYLDEAVKRGASAALIGPGLSGPKGFPVIQVADIRRAQGLVASTFYGDPSRKLKMIGVTGTNGKTTVTHLIEYLLNSAGIPVGLIGTVWTKNGKDQLFSARTTPDAIELQKTLAVMLENGLATVVMEVSSHALALERVSGIDFDVAVLTNITHDHFDFHQDYEHYLAAKEILFQRLKPRRGYQRYAAINLDDHASARIAEVCQTPILFYGSSPEADIRVETVVRQGFESKLTLDLSGERCEIATRLPGAFNVYNLLAAITVAHQEGVSIDEIENAALDFPGVPGRYQEIRFGQPFRIMVDFAHNPAALQSILQMAREDKKGRLILVFGCEGEKDRAKRPLMGKIAVENADIVILTADNLYHEDFIRIKEDVIQGFTDLEQKNILIEPDRRKAISIAMKIAAPGDFVIIAGKGHEQYLIKGSEQIKFDDTQVIQEILNPEIINYFHKSP